MHWIADRCMDLNPDGSMQIMYGYDGRKVLTEQTLPHLEGYRGSAPVRIGNGAFDQLQLDIYGELMDAVYLHNKYGELISADLWDNLIRLVNYVCDNWHRPDEGIWEVRGGQQEFLYSRLMCWVAVDRGIRLADRRSLPYPRERWYRTRDQIYREIFTEYFDPSRQAFIQHKGAKTLDASNLLMPLVRFISPTEASCAAAVRRGGTESYSTAPDALQECALRRRSTTRQVTAPIEHRSGSEGAERRRALGVPRSPRVPRPGAYRTCPARRAIPRASNAARACPRRGRKIAQVSHRTHLSYRSTVFSGLSWAAPSLPFRQPVFRRQLSDQSLGRRGDARAERACQLVVEGRVVIGAQHERRRPRRRVSGEEARHTGQDLDAGVIVIRQHPREEREPSIVHLLRRQLEVARHGEDLIGRTRDACHARDPQHLERRQERMRVVGEVGMRRVPR